MAQGYYYYDDKYYDKDIIWEVTLGAGIMNCITDIYGSRGSGSGPLNSVNFKRSKFAGSLGINAVYKEVLGARLEFTNGNVTAFDKDNKTNPANSKRNLDFSSYVREISAALEFFPLPLFQNPLKQPSRFYPYAIGGLGWFAYDPTTELNGKTIRLQPLSLEGQGFAEYPEREPYKLNAFSFQLGMGIKYEIGALLNCRLEVVRRSTNTNFLDDVGHLNWAKPELFDKYLSPGNALIAHQLYDRSMLGVRQNGLKTRAISEHNDVFWTAMVKIGLVINRGRR